MSAEEVLKGALSSMARLSGGPVATKPSEPAGTGTMPAPQWIRPPEFKLLRLQVLDGANVQEGTTLSSSSAAE
jgi:hypothetical protein